MSNKELRSIATNKVAKKNVKRSTVKKVDKKTAKKASKDTIDAPKRRGRPKGSKNKIKDGVEQSAKKTVRTKESKCKDNQLKKQYVKKLEKEILDSIPQDQIEKTNATDIMDQVLFKIPAVKYPLVGTPKEVQRELDALVKQMQKNNENDETFNRIHLYMHTYLVNMVLKKFPFIRGSQTVDIYQETLIALRFKAIPGFKLNKGMSFLNFAKLCIRRHLITLLNASRHKMKDKAINSAISLDSNPIDGEDGDSGNTLSNLIGDDKLAHDKVYEREEAFVTTKNTLDRFLSDFEKEVLKEHLSNMTYKEIAKILSNKFKEYYNAKSIDNALLRIKKKALHLREHCKEEDIPIFIVRNENI